MSKEVSVARSRACLADALHVLRKGSALAALVLVTGFAAAPCNAANGQLVPPRPAAQEMPDWSGVWSSNGGFLFDNKTGEVREDAPFNAEYQAKYDGIMDAAARGVPLEDLGAMCFPPGLPRVMFQNYPLEFIVTPNQVWILQEYQSQARRIYTDGRKHPEELDPSFNGYSVGHWEGETLVVDSRGIRADLRLDRYVPHSDALRVIERIRRVNATTMEDRITVEDSKALTRPWTTVRTYTLQPTWEMREYECAENNRDIILPRQK